MAHSLYWPQKSFFYPIGNTTPRLLNEYLGPKEDGNILLLGCGDPRNVLFTIDANRESLLNGSVKLDFTCVDIESAILARNIVLFTLAIDKNHASEAASAFHIFYDFFLNQEAVSLLKNHCRNLLELSPDLKTWNSGPYARVIRLCSVYTLTELRRCWQAYVNTDTIGDFRTRYREEMEAVKKCHESVYIRGRSAGPFFADAISVMTNVFHEFWKTGTSLTDPADIASATHVNPMFAHWSQGDGFVSHHSTFPPSPFLLAPFFATAQASTSPTPVSGADIFRFVKDEFQRWYRAFSDVTRQSSSGSNVEIRFLIGDALHVCHTLFQASENNSAGFFISAWNPEPLVLDSDDLGTNSESKLPTTFNVIETSNLADHLGILNLLIAAIPLLTRSPTSTLHTETLLEYGDNAEDSISAFSTCLGTDLVTMSVLLDLAPCTLASNFNTHCNVQEVVPYPATVGMGQFHERTVWKIFSTIESPDANTSTAFDPDILAKLLFNVYLKLFPWEDLTNRMRNIALGTSSNPDRIHHSRLTVALLIRLIQRHIVTDWHKTIKNLLSLMSSGKTILLGPQSVQDFSCHLDKLGIYSITNFAPVDPAEVARLTRFAVKRMQIFDVVPPLICLILVVPREKLSILDDPDLGNPGLQTVVRSDKFINYFTPGQAVFGTVVAGETEDVSYVEPDPLGRSGSAPLLLTFWIPSWTLTLTTSAITVALSVQKTTQTSKLASRLGSNLEVFSTYFEDKESVYLTRDIPRLGRKRELPVSPTYPKFSSPPQPSVTAAASTDFASIRSLVYRVNIEEPDAKAQLAQKTTAINVAQKTPCSVELSLGTTLRKDLHYPFPVNGVEAMLRIARTSSYIEVVSPLASFDQPGGMRLNRFPITRSGTGSTSWNLHRVDLDHLPALDSNPQKLQWLGGHVTYMMSQKEREILGGNGERDATVDDLLDLKHSLHLILTTSAGVFQPRKSTFVLTRQDNHSVAALIFVAGLYIDTQAHTVVADSFVLPMDQDDLKTIVKPISALSSTAFGVNITSREYEIWKRLLPAMAERCRTWEHMEDCVDRENPLLSNLCRCGRGQATTTFTEQKEWDILAPYVTRVALSPLFSVSYLDPM